MSNVRKYHIVIGSKSFFESQLTDLEDVEYQFNGSKESPMSTEVTIMVSSESTMEEKYVNYFK